MLCRRFKTRITEHCNP